MLQTLQKYIKYVQEAFIYVLVKGSECFLVQKLKIFGFFKLIIETKLMQGNYYDALLLFMFSIIINTS